MFAAFTPRFSNDEVAQVLADLQRRFPNATADDARTILMDAHWAVEDEKAFEARDCAQCEAELDRMADAA